MSNYLEQAQAEQTEQVETSENMKKLKEEAGLRSRRIGKILRTAFTETAAELKAGTTVLSPVAKELTKTAAENIKQTSQAAVSEVNQSWVEEEASQETPDRIQALFRAIARIFKESWLPKAQTQASGFDESLKARYGDRYGAVKQRWNGFKAWYAKAAEKEINSVKSAMSKPATAQPSETAMTVDTAATEIEIS
ncbi:hypothetical protein IQ241_14965 [Romeria aff. gracilis LEGE 07310]|uniref:Uncharacterized protein n=1 Tax=Vasconcelosia minhoensis LEGE 07310 TaxID=915328 RepID=A0A8J7AQ29_9CYAN|nr:hypothetical protein [Romeria gracilis]MBE9078579.1 hypothetical protein [Romeria aff. gracilis LEGE 07310]